MFVKATMSNGKTCYVNLRRVQFYYSVIDAFYNKSMTRLVFRATEYLDIIEKTKDFNHLCR